MLGLVGWAWLVLGVVVDDVDDVGGVGWCGLCWWALDGVGGGCDGVSG